MFHDHGARSPSLLHQTRPMNESDITVTTVMRATAIRLFRVANGLAEGSNSIGKEKRLLGRNLVLAMESGVERMPTERGALNSGRKL